MFVTANFIFDTSGLSSGGEMGENISHFISRNAGNFLPMFLVFFERNA